MSAAAPGAGAARVLVTDGETRAALAAVRALGAAGHEVHVVSARGRSLSGASRHARTDRGVGDPADAPRAWAEALEREADAAGAELILPVTEVSLGTVYAFGIDARRPVLCPERAAYERAVDKHGVIECAASLGIEVPRTQLVGDPAALVALPEPFRYPAVVKARRSRFLRDGRWLASDARIVRGPDDLRPLREDPASAGGLLVQEFVPGRGEAVFLLVAEGRARVRFAHRRLREKPPTGGVSVLSESVAPDPGLLAQSERLLARLGYAGLAMVEFRRTPDGRAVLMEINPRLWGSLQLAVDAGVDFPSLLVALHRGEPLPTVEPRLGVRTRWLLGDLDHLLASLRRREVRALTGRGVAALLRDFLRSFADGSRPEVLRRDDWRPFARELRTRWWRES